PRQQDYIEKIKQSGQHLLGIINDILDFSKIESGKMELEQVEFDVRSLFVSTEKALAVRAGQKSLELVYDVDGEVPDVLMGDPGRLRQVLTNLLGNAIKFSDHGVIGLRMRLLSMTGRLAQVRIEVSDQGIGIPEDKLAHIFDAFTQADTSTTRKYGGTGLGLAISSQLVAAMGGKLDVESEVGVGSVFSFTVTFPVSEICAAENAPEALQGMSALIVDDNPTNRHLLVQLLEKWGMLPVEADSADEAVRMINWAQQQGAPYQLILLDAMMPDKDGFELAAELQQDAKTQSGPLMMLSSAGGREELQRCQELGISAYLTKPVDRDELLSVICKALDISRKVSAGSRAVTKSASQYAAEQRSLSVLLAEDNSVNQKLAITLLEKWGHNVALAHNGREALEKSRMQRFDVILMDLQMPEMGGIEVTQLIRADEQASGRHTPVFAMTANAMPEDRQRCLDAGMDDYIAKPLDSERLYAMLHGLASTGSATDDTPVNERVDYATALNKADGWVIETIGQAFLDDCERQMSEIAAAIESQNMELLMRGAHTLRGVVSNFNAKGVAAIAREIELLAEQGQLNQVDGLFDKLQGEMDMLKVALVEYLARLPGT
ncbi:MAG: response regulator, partial [Gallionella sp.]|nr:response regulator [Gallionella sp.]